MRRLLLAASAIMAAGGACAQLDIGTMTKANGLAEIIYKAEHCKYVLDQSKLEAYFAQNHLDSPEILNWISMATDAASIEGPPTASACTLARATALKIGILAN